MVTVNRSDIEIRPDPTRVVAKPFLPGETTFAGGPTRVELIADRALQLSKPEASRLLERTRASFAGRHLDLENVWEENVTAATAQYPDLEQVVGERRALLGAFFTQEYAPEAAAVCNPSMVPLSEPNTDGRFILSLRAIGEGHISSVEFRSGYVDSEGSAQLDAPTPYLSLGSRRTPIYENKTFRDKLVALNADPTLVGVVMDQLPDRFSFTELEAALDLMQRGEVSGASAFETSRLIQWLAASNYELSFSGAEPISERVLLPASPAESRGIEDARFVRFVEEDDTTTYYATYTAWDGFSILPQLIETRDFVTFRFATLNGACARNKGMALFPRRIGGLYTAIGRHDLENLHILRSDQLRVWNHSELLCAPERGWETVQLGTCGSPIETPEGWLVLTHGVGPMRTYALGALLLDLERPTQVIGRLETPLLEADPDERDGYVPNVVYSCGAMAHAGWLVIPYGFSDRAVRIAKVALDELLEAMV
ncbi:MAG: glycoside hydrolase family 130 protein [Acidimicrobiia bacterium]|jgi:predicted GH43/DUF377 family glycosyl hydrolase